MFGIKSKRLWSFFEIIESYGEGNWDIDDFIRKEFDNIIKRRNMADLSIKYDRLKSIFLFLPSTSR